MYNLPDSVEKLINSLSMLPGIGPKSAQRLAFYILKSPMEEASRLSESVISAREAVRPCVICGNFTDREECAICRSHDRDRSVVCVVENPQDILAVESSGEYNGLFHVLMGALSPLDGINPEDLRIDELVSRVKKGDIKEVIIATDPNVEGEATAAYIKEVLNEFPVKVTHLAYGIPMGGNLEYADGVTLGKALQGRREF
jgi:recombination protein RecR